MGLDAPFSGSDGAGNGDRDPVLRVRRLRKLYRSGSILPGSGGRQWVRAVDGVDLDVIEGATLGLVGESGCGKSTTARLLLNLEATTSGVIEFKGEDISNLSGAGYAEFRRAVQSVFQDPASSLSPRRRIRQLIAEPIVATTKLRARDAEERVMELIEAVGLDASCASLFPHQLSGGMRQRVAIAQALASQPSIIILDEPVSALDVSIQAQIMNLLKDVQDEFGVSYLLIAHDLATVRYLSQTVVAMYLGTIVERAPSNTFFADALHPYTLALMSAAVPTGPAEDREMIVLEGDIPSPASPPSGCRFHTRCWLRPTLDDGARCATEVPDLRSVGDRHDVACHFIDESASSPLRQEILSVIESSNPALSQERQPGNGT